MHNRSNHEAAAREAFEEAGVRGKVAPEAIGLYPYRKELGRGRSVPVVVQVFPLEVSEMLRQYPENGQRRAKWFSRKDASRKVLEPQLQKLIRKFSSK